MNRTRIRLMSLGAALGLLLLATGWGCGNFYLVVAGAVVAAAALAALTMPMPAIL